ncbi:MAG: hypothetical protein A2020_09790 [Lentisphaerae bacterium GWF2_45_14]|nr:MAG: hypothetical protein A2020_09790 [Lentisphaerae bacterium GWF2_45_14]
MIKKFFSILILSAGYIVSLSAQELDHIYDISQDRARLEAECKLAHQKASAEGVTSRKSHMAIDKKYQGAARALENKRQGAVKELFDKADIEMPKQMGTDPASGRGIFGDIDTANMSTENIKKLNNVIEAHNNSPGVTRKYTVVDKGGYVQVKELDMTTFKQFPDPDKFVFTRGAGKETALAYRTDASGGTSNEQIRRVDKNGKVTVIKEKAAVVDRHIYNLDNMKKVGGDLSKTDIGDVDFQNVGKGTMRILENTYGPNLEGIKDPAKKAKMQELLDKCRDMKNYSPETAGIQSDEQKKKFIEQAKETIGDAYKEHAGTTEKVLVEQRDDSWKKIEELKEKLKASKGQNAELKAELEAAKTFYDAESKALYKYRQTQLAAESGVVKNGGAELLADAKGQKVRQVDLPEGGKGYLDVETNKTLSKSQLSEELLAPQKKQITGDSFPAKASGSAPDSSNTSSLGKNPGFINGVNMADDVVEMYQLYKTVGEYLPNDMDPNTKKGVQLLLTAASANQIAKGAIQASIGGGQAGFDELVEWYKTHPGQEPDQWETFKIGLRGGNNFLADTAKGMAYGFTVKPFQDVYDIGYGLGDTIAQRRNAEEAKAVEDAKDAEVKDVIGNKISAMQDTVRNCEDIVKNILAQKDTTRDERKQANQIDGDITSVKKHIHNLELTTANRRNWDIDSRLKEYNFVESQVEKLAKSTTLLQQSFQNCFLTIRVTNSEDNSPCVDSWINIRGAGCSNVLRDSSGGVFNVNALLSGTYSFDIYGRGRTTKKDSQIILDRAKNRYYSIGVKLDVAAEEAPNYAQFTITALDSATKKAVSNVKFSLLNNQRPAVDFNSPTGSMGMNLEFGECKIQASSPGYAQSTLSFKVDTRASASKNIYLELSKSGTAPAAVSDKRKKYQVVVRAEHPVYLIDKSEYSCKLVSVDTNREYPSDRSKYMYVPAGKYRLELSSPVLKPVSMVIEVNSAKKLNIPVEPKLAPETYSVSFNLPAFEQMVQYNKINDFLKSKAQQRQVFTTKREGCLEVRLKARGKGDISVSLIEQGKQDGGLGIVNTCYGPGKENRSASKTYRIRNVNNDIGKNVVVWAGLWDSHVKKSRKSDYDAEDKIIFTGGSFSAEIIFHPLPLK